MTRKPTSSTSVIYQKLTKLAVCRKLASHKLLSRLLRQGEQPGRRKGRDARTVRWRERREVGLLVVV